MSDLLNTREVAEYLRLKPRTVYDLVQRKAIPCVRCGGKWLFPRDRIDRWLADRASEGTVTDGGRPPPVVTGPDDPFLDWCVAESGCGLALAPSAPADGLARFAEGKAVACGLVVPDGAGGDAMPASARRTLPPDTVVIRWARRQRGAVAADGAPAGRVAIEDARRRGRLAVSAVFMTETAEGDAAGPVLRDEMEVALAVLDGRADAGLPLVAVARRLRMDVVSQGWEWFDLLIRRYDGFEPPFQALLATARTAAARNRAAAFGGYDLDALGTVRANGIRSR